MQFFDFSVKVRHDLLVFVIIDAICNDNEQNAGSDHSTGNPKVLNRTSILKFRSELVVEASQIRGKVK